MPTLLIFDLLIASFPLWLSGGSVSCIATDNLRADVLAVAANDGQLLVYHSGCWYRILALQEFCGMLGLGLIYYSGCYALCLGYIHCVGDAKFVLCNMFLHIIKSPLLFKKNFAK